MGDRLGSRIGAASRTLHYSESGAPKQALMSFVFNARMPRVLQNSYFGELRLPRNIKDLRGLGKHQIWFWRRTCRAGGVWQPRWAVGLRRRPGPKWSAAMPAMNRWRCQKKCPF